ncbi:MAG: ExeM/NucH family extracellular endonuclease [Actinomycetaceae bacterium]|nr:ExeM/NucH family extracellular endonuclease [Actinomycetaceae bacterium]
MQHMQTTTRVITASVATLALMGISLPAFAANEGDLATANVNITPIADIQGAGASTPLAGKTVTTKGVVTASYGDGTFRGYYLQTPGTGGDVKTAGKSDGIFVYTASATPPEIGTCLEVTGKASEYYKMTQLSGTTSVQKDDCAAVEPYKLAALPATDAEYEQYEGMLLAPQGPYTVTDTYKLNSDGMITLANSDKPLPQATDVVAPGEDANAQEDANLAKQIFLDDGTKYEFRHFRSNNRSDLPLPYIDADTIIRVGAKVKFTDGVILDYRWDTWAFQPRQMQVRTENSPVTFENTRPKAPAEVGGDIQIGTFNVLNYFVTLGKDGENCTAYDDREGNPIATSNCAVRGAYDEVNFARQEGKIVKAINALNADVVGLQEIENSTSMNPDRDKALAHLVKSLKKATGEDTWDYVASPTTVPNNTDAIRTAFIYKKAAVAPVGESVILNETDGEDFVTKARSPLAQTFKTLNAPEGQENPEFVVINNHFKSKGSSAKGEGDDDTGDGQGSSNGTRTRQATQLAEFANTFENKPVFLLGDFNSYTQEDPMMILQDAGFTNLTAKDDGYSYVYDGRVGSLDHILANEAGAALMTGADIWMINANEPLLTEYSRYNYNVPLLYTDDIYRASDHNPAKVGLNLYEDSEGDTEKPGKGESEYDDESHSETTTGKPVEPTNPSVEPSVDVDDSGDKVAGDKLAKTGIAAGTLAGIAILLAAAGAITLLIRRKAE